MKIYKCNDFVSLQILVLLCPILLASSGVLQYRLHCISSKRSAGGMAQLEVGRPGLQASGEHCFQVMFSEVNGDCPNRVLLHMNVVDRLPFFLIRSLRSYTSEYVRSL